jgi:hypothetical protein
MGWVLFGTSRDKFESFQPSSAPSSARRELLMPQQHEVAHPELMRTAFWLERPLEPLLLQSFLILTAKEPASSLIK